MSCLNGIVMLSCLLTSWSADPNMQSGVGLSRGAQSSATSLHRRESRDGSTHVSKKHNELPLTAYILQCVCTLQPLLTCDVVFVCSPVEVCDTLFANENDVGTQAQLLKLCMPLLSLQITEDSPQSATTSGHSPPTIMYQRHLCHRLPQQHDNLHTGFVSTPSDIHEFCICLQL